MLQGNFITITNRRKLLLIRRNLPQFAAICRDLPQFTAKPHNLPRFAAICSSKAAKTPQLIAKRLRHFFGLHPCTLFFAVEKIKDQNWGQQFHWLPLPPKKQLF
jgi:hypothetical protein